jgi:uncharacterized protein
MMRAIDVKGIIDHPGSSLAATLHEPLEGLSTELASVPEDRPIDGRLLLESVVEGILASGRLTGTMALRCARCLQEFVRPFDVEVEGELFTYQPSPDSDDYPLQPAGELDPEQLVRDAVGLELPFSPLCRPDCLGLCPVCGGDLNLGECPGHETTDPRWQELDSLLTEDDDRRAR